MCGNLIILLTLQFWDAQFITLKGIIGVVFSQGVCADGQKRMIHFCSAGLISEAGFIDSPALSSLPPPVTPFMMSP